MHAQGRHIHVLIASDYYATSEYMKGVEIQNFGEIEKCDEIINIYEQSPVREKHSKLRGNGLS